MEIDPLRELTKVPARSVVEAGSPMQSVGSLLLRAIQTSSWHIFSLETRRDSSYLTLTIGSIYAALYIG